MGKQPTVLHVAISKAEHFALESLHFIAFHFIPSPLLSMSKKVLLAPDCLTTALVKSHKTMATVTYVNFYQYKRNSR